MAFEIGDKVIYPNHGLGIIERVETKTIMGTTCGFYQLRMANETTVFVPVDNVDGVGLRRAIEDSEVSRLFDLLGDGQIESHQNWKGRFKDNSDRMRTGSIYDVVEVLKSLSHLSKSKSLSFREKRMLDRAKFLVISEISEVIGEKVPQVEVKVDTALELCFVAKAKNGNKPKVTVVVAPPAMPVAAPVVAAPAPVPVAVAPVAKPIAKPAAPAVRPAAPSARVAAPARAAAPARPAASARPASRPATPARPAAPAPRAATPAARATAKTRSAAAARVAPASRARASATSRTGARRTARAS